MKASRPVRFVHEGADPLDSRKVTAIGHSKVDRSKIYIQKVQTIEQYEAGCREHEDCPGHMVETPSGILLPPQYMSLRTNIMKNEVYEAAQYAFKPATAYNYSEYLRILSGMMKGKDGKMRKGVLTSPVDGSLRMVVIPHDKGETLYEYHPQYNPKKPRQKYIKHPDGTYIPNEKVIFLPYYLRDKFKVMRVSKETGKYTAEYVKDGDSGYLVREPALHGGSAPFVYIFFWKSMALGAHPELMKGLLGDYDGDELQLYPIYSNEAVAICSRWIVEPHPDFEKANKIYDERYYPDKGTGSLDFMWHTTMSFKEIKEGHPPPLMCEYNRMTLQNIETFRKRCNTSFTASTLIESSIEGLNSINVQQHSQSIVGDMSRIARLAASSIIQTEDGMINIMTDKGLIPTYMSTVDTESGNTAVRAQSRLCAKAQQVMLSAHRVTKSAMPSHDMIKEIVVGTDAVFFSVDSKAIRNVDNMNIDNDDISWMAKMKSVYYILSKSTDIACAANDWIKSAYNPVILSRCRKSKRFKICRKGIQNVFLQYDVPVSDVELDCLAVLYSYKVEKSDAPITSRKGLSARTMHWTDTAMATSYFALKESVKYKNIAPQKVNTVTSAIMVRNFDLI